MHKTQHVVFDPFSLLLLKDIHALEANMNLMESRHRGSIIVLLSNNNVTEISTVWCLKYDALHFLFKVVPEQPQNLSCIQKGEHGTVTCIWDRGRDTHLYTAYTLQ